MPPKALSSSTLSLRFMRNADQKHTVPQAQVRDDAEWELPQDVRSTLVRDDTVTYEHSYLPFLFDQPKGRRTFDKHGKEVTQVCRLAHSPTLATYMAQIPATADPPQATTTVPPPTAGAGTTSKAPRPKTISSFGSNVKKEKERDPSKAAKYIIRDLSGVGKDLRARPPPSPTGFMKPEGVDLPVGRSIKKEGGTTEDGTRRAKKKRVRDPGTTSGDGGHGGPTAESGAVEKKPKIE